MEYIPNLKLSSVNLKVHQQDISKNILTGFLYIYNEKRFLLNKVKTESYSKILIDNNYIKSNDIFKIKMPIDLNIAYAEYINQS